MNKKKELEFWKEVSGDFRKNTRARYLCLASSRFAARWERQGKGYFYKSLVEKFLEETRSGLTAGITYLFPGAENPRKIRLQFLRWVIKNLENEITAMDQNPDIRG